MHHWTSLSFSFLISRIRRTLSFLSSFLPFLAMPCDLWKLSSLTRDQTYGPCTGSKGVLTTGPPRNSQENSFFFKYCTKSGEVELCTGDLDTLRHTTKIKSVLLFFLFPGLYRSSEFHRISVLFTVLFMVVFFCIYVLEFNGIFNKT